MAGQHAVGTARPRRETRATRRAGRCRSTSTVRSRVWKSSHRSPLRKRRRNAPDACATRHARHAAERRQPWNPVRRVHACVLRERDGKWQLERGAARFDAQPVALPAQPGLFVTGDWPQFDLTEWLALRDAGRGAGGSEGGRLSDWLGPVDVHLGSRDGARLPVPGRNRAPASSTATRGASTRTDRRRRASSPCRMTCAGGKPIVLDMKRLAPGCTEAPAAKKDRRTPGRAGRRIRARCRPITLRADDFAWHGRRFGQLQAAVGKDPRGLVLQTLATTAPEFSIVGAGQLVHGTGGHAHAARGGTHQHGFRRHGARAGLSRCRGCPQGALHGESDLARRTAREHSRRS